MSALTALSLAEARAALAKKEFSARELAEAHIRAIERRARSMPSSPRRPSARSPWPGESDRGIARGEARPLEGIPLAIKDLFCTRGIRTTAGSHILDNFVPPYELTVTRQALGRGRGAARQDQSGRVRHGLVQRHQLFRPGG